MHFIHLLLRNLELNSEHPIIRVIHEICGKNHERTEIRRYFTKVLLPWEGMSDRTAEKEREKGHDGRSINDTPALMTTDTGVAIDASPMH